MIYAFVESFQFERNERIMTIGIVGNYGNNNQGDEAILEGIIIQLEDAYHIKREDIIVFSNNPEQTRERYGVQSVNLFQRRRLDPMKFIATVIHNRPIIKELDVLLIGGGGILMDLYRNNPIVYGMYGLIAKLAKTPAIIYGAGAGPISTKLGKTILKALGNSAEVLLVRDTKSKALLQSIGVHKRMEVISDPAFFVKAPERKSGNKAGLQIGVTAVPYYYKNYWPTRDDQKYNNYINGMAQNFDNVLRENPSAQVNFFSTHPRDIVVTEEIQNIMTYKNRTTVCKKELTHREILQFISEQDLLIGTRLHSLILSLVTETPIIAVSYHQKVQDFMDDADCSSRVIDIEKLHEQESFFVDQYNEMNEDWDETVAHVKEIKEKIKSKEPHGMEVVKEVYRYTS